LPTILLAIADNRLATPVRRRLERAGHVTISVRRALAVLTEAKRTAWDLVVLDGSTLGRETLVVLGGIDDAPIIGLGFEDLRLSRFLPLPLDARALTDAVDALSGPSSVPATALVLRPERRAAEANGHEVRLTDIEFRLLETLLANRPSIVPVQGVIQAVWGASGVGSTPASLRSHVRNLRSKLAQIGLSNALRARRGRGYSLAV
jgi:DNA-binding response OmpR family regulator